MQVGINLLYLLPGVVGGTQTYAEELLYAISQLESQHHFTVFVNQESADLSLPSIPNLTKVVCPVYARSRSARYRYEQFRFQRELRKRNIDVLHSLGYVGPLFTPCRHIVTIHDLIYVGFKDAMSFKRRIALRFFVKNTALRADHIVTVSESSKRQIVADTKVSPDKVTVVYEAGKTRKGQEDAISDADVLEHYKIDKPYIVAFSSLSVSKNIPRLVQAVSLIQGDFPHQLMLIGHIPPEANLADCLFQQGMKQRVTITGYVPDTHVMPLIRNAELFVFPSWYEGFGLPVLDAQQVGVPVACSKAASLPEVAGQGAVFFDPYSVEEMASAIRLCLSNPALQADLKRLGYLNAERFSWKDTARQMLVLYERIAGPEHYRPAVQSHVRESG